METNESFDLRKIFRYSGKALRWVFCRSKIRLPGCFIKKRLHILLKSWLEFSSTDFPLEIRARYNVIQLSHSKPNKMLEDFFIGSHQSGIGELRLLKQMKNGPTQLGDGIRFVLREEERNFKGNSSFIWAFGCFRNMSWWWSSRVRVRVRIQFLPHKLQKLYE